MLVGVFFSHKQTSPWSRWLGFLVSGGCIPSSAVPLLLCQLRGSSVLLGKGLRREVVSPEMDHAKLQ